MKLNQFAWSIALLAAFETRLYAWGDDGHKASAQAAYDLLSPKAKQFVDTILAGESLDAAAVWPDKIRGGIHPGPLAGSPEGKSFNKKFPHNSLWHFVDLPLDTQTYAQNVEFTSTNDVVHALANCIDVLEAKSAQMTKLEALRWTLHLAGDVHQPLHVGCGYFEFDDQNDPHLHTDPQYILLHGIKDGDDKGANRLRYAATEKLHHYWDTVLVGHLPSNNQSLKDTLAARILQAGYKNSGAYRSWPAKWAAASVQAARNAYDGIDFNYRGEDHGDWFINITLPPLYQQNNVPVAADQLAKAAFHLSSLLNRIKWK